MNVQPSVVWAGCMLIATSLAAQREIFVPASDVSFKISIERKNYGVRERISVKYQIVNVSNVPLYVPRGFDATVCLDIVPRAGPHVQGGFRDSAGKHFEPGWGASCSSTPGVAPPTIAERMSKVAILLPPGKHFDGAFQLDPTMFRLTAGAYRIEAVLLGWKSEQFSAAERTELEALSAPLLSGEVPASQSIKLLTEQ